MTDSLDAAHERLNYAKARVARSGYAMPAERQAALDELTRARADLLRAKAERIESTIGKTSARR